MIKLKYKDLINKTGLTNHAKYLAQNNDAFLKISDREMNLHESQHLGSLIKDLKIAGNLNPGAYSQKRNEIILYAVRNNINNDMIVEFVSSEKFRPHYEKQYKYKQALIIVIKGAVNKLPEIDSYIKKLSEEGKEIKYDEDLKKESRNAEEEFNSICTYYEIKPLKIIRLLQEEYHKGNYRFRHNQEENNKIIEVALKMLQTKEKLKAKAVKAISDLSSLSKFWISHKKDFQSLSTFQLTEFLTLIKQYVQEFHRDDLKSEEKAASRKSSEDNYIANNPGHITLRMRKQKVRELYKVYKNYSKVEEILRNTPYYTTRQSISKWIK